MRWLLLFLPLAVAGCDKPVTIEAWVLEADLQHPPGVRVMADGEAAPLGKPASGIRVVGIESCWTDRLPGPCGCCSGYIHLDQSIAGALGGRHWPNGTMWNLGESDAQGRLTWIWHPKRTEYEFMKLISGVDVGNDPGAWEAWFKAHPHLVWDEQKGRLAEKKTKADKP